MDLKPHPSKGPALKAIELPPIPAGEDDTSFERRNRILKLEYAKAHPNVAAVKELMKTTFAMRRDILSEGHKFDVGKYPFLQLPDHVRIFFLIYGSVMIVGCWLRSLTCYIMILLRCGFNLKTDLTGHTLWLGVISKHANRPFLLHLARNFRPLLSCYFILC